MKKLLMLFALFLSEDCESKSENIHISHFEFKNKNGSVVLDVPISSNPKLNQEIQRSILEVISDAYFDTIPLNDSPKERARFEAAAKKEIDSAACHYLFLDEEEKCNAPLEQQDQEYLNEYMQDQRPEAHLLTLDRGDLAPPYLGRYQSYKMIVSYDGVRAGNRFNYTILFITVDHKAQKVISPFKDIFSDNQIRAIATFLRDSILQVYTVDDLFMERFGFDDPHDINNWIEFLKYRISTRDVGFVSFNSQRKLEISLDNALGTVMADRGNQISIPESVYEVSE